VHKTFIHLRLIGTKYRDMLKRLFTSNTRIKLLSLFLLNPNKEFFVRELTRLLDEQINSIRRELENLKKLGLLKSRAKNRKKFYFINPSFKLFKELELIFKKCHNEGDEISRKISRCGEIDLIALTGIFINRASTSPIDILIVGEVDRDKLENFLQNEMNFERPVRYSVMGKEDFLYRWRFHDKFLHDIIKNHETNVSVNKLDNVMV